MNDGKELWGFEYLAANIPDRDVRVSLIDHGLLRPYILYFLDKKDPDKIRDLVVGLAGLGKIALNEIYNVGLEGEDLSCISPYLNSILDADRKLDRHRKSLNVYHSARILTIHYLNENRVDEVKSLINDEDNLIREGVANALIENNFAGISWTEDEKLRFKIRSILIKLDNNLLGEVTKLEDKAIPHLIEAGNDTTLSRNSRVWAIFVLETLAYNLFVEERYSHSMRVIKEALKINSKIYKKEIKDRSGEKYKLIKERRERLNEVEVLATDIREVLNKLPKQRPVRRKKPRPARRKLVAVYR